MKQIALKIRDKKFKFFMELIGYFDFVKVVKEEKEPTKKDIVKGIKKAVKEVNLIRAGKKKGIPAKELLREL